MRNRTLVLMRPADPDEPSAGYDSLGTVEQFRDACARYNTAPDGSERSSGTDLLHGPGFVIEFSSPDGKVQQALITVTDHESAPPVLARLCRGNGWKMQDVDTGMTFG